MIFIIRENGDFRTYSAKDTIEAMEHLLNTVKAGTFVDYWQALPEGSIWGTNPENKRR